MTPYEQLVAKMQELADLRGAIAMMAWDQETYMPEGAAGIRARQVSTLQGLSHQKHIQEVKPLLEAVEAQGDALSDARQRLNVVKIRRDLDKQEKLPLEHVVEFSRVASEGTHAWTSAKKENDWEAFRPHLEKLVALKRKEADYLGYAENPYDALIDHYEPDMKASHLRKVFDMVKKELAPLLAEIRAAKQVKESFLRVEIDEEAQMTFGVNVLKAMGFSLAHGRQDLSSHPFTMAISAKDVRITTAVRPDDIREMLYSSVHEGGHAIYEQGLSMAEYGLPGGESCSLSIHESQSRLWENNVARSAEFWEHYTDQLRELYPDGLAGYTSEHVFQAMNRVEPGLIRIYSDELTYHFHIILRFEIEDDLINGRIEVEDLPRIWNEKIKSYLGLDVPSHREGILQDIHWSFGSFGYFPTYSLGSLYAAQLMAAVGQDLPDLNEQIRKGNLLPVKEWMNEKIHDQGRLYSAEDLCKMATGEGLNVKYFAEYARKKFTRIYGLK